MAAYFEYSSDTGYYLDEERIRNLHKIITESHKNNDDSHSIEFEVYRSDNFHYKTGELEEILKEDNSEWRKITAIEISSTNNSTLIDSSLQLTFSIPKRKNRSPQISLYLQGKDRDFVFLLGSELRTYLDNEVKYRVPRLVSWIKKGESGSVPYEIFTRSLLLGLQFLLLFALIYLSIWNISDLLSIIEYSERDSSASSHSKVIFFAATLAFLLTSIIIIPLVSYYLFPNCLFLFGKELSIHQKKIQIRSNLFWVVVVGLLISILGGVILSFIAS